MTETKTSPTIGRDLVVLGRDGHPTNRTVCPQCRKELSRVGITDLVYTFEKCACSKASYVHLVEQLWHRNCFAASPLLAPEESK